MIFGKYAREYWKLNLPVIPLVGKRPVTARWSAYADTMPTETDKKTWLAAYSDNNMGLPLGPQSGLVAIDVDVDDPKVEAVLNRVLPKSPWKRIGAKGYVAIYRYNGQRTFRIDALEEEGRRGRRLMELLSKGAQVVLPPSIHPDTGREYTVVDDVDLLDLVRNGSIPALPKDVESIIRACLEEEGFRLSARGWTKVAAYVPAGARDNALVSHAGILARAILRGERTFLEAVSEIKHWVETYPEKVVGDVMPVEKGIERLVHFLGRDVLGDKKRSLPIGWDEGLTDEDWTKMGLDVFKDSVQWSSKEIIDYLTGILESHAKNSVEVFEAVDRVLGKISGLGTMEADRILDWINSATGKAVKLSTMRKRMAELEKGEIEGKDHTEIAKAVLKDLTQYGDVKYWGTRFWQWKGACWEILDEWEIRRFIAEDYGHLPSARKFHDHNGILNILRGLCQAELKEVSINGLNFANGYLTEDLELKPHLKEHGCTYVLPYRYMPEEAGKCPKFMQFLDDVWGGDEDKEEKIAALRQAIAVTMFQVSSRYQRAICLHGIARSGKSTLMDIVANLMPEQAISNVSPADWADKFAPARMHGALLNLCGELPDASMIEGSKFKQIVDGQAIDGQFKGKDLFKFRPLCAQWFATNHLPRSRDTSEGFVRRWLFLDFTRQVPEDQRISNIANVIVADEQEAIAAWAAEGIRSLVEKEEFVLPKSHKKLADEVANANNSVRFFLTSSGRVTLEPSKSPITEIRLHSIYWAFCLATGGVSPVGLRSFRQKMKEMAPLMGFKIITKVGEKGLEETVYDGLTVVGK